MYASILQKGEQVTYTYSAGRVGYIHVVDTKGGVTIDDNITLHGGDGAFISSDQTIKIEGAASESEFVLFDLKEEQ
jgi:redox-sensitive bicupin YhaK (pirin superfamily)